MTVAAIATGVSVRVLGKYRIQIWGGWVFGIIGLGLLSAIRVTTPYGLTVLYQLFIGMGLGPLYPVMPYPILASLPIHYNSRALALYTFLRSFGQVRGFCFRL
jgi:hypothetical protein